MTVHVEQLSPVDNLGRCRFITRWPADNIGPHCDETGLRGQVFFTDLAAHVASWRADGFEVAVSAVSQAIDVAALGAEPPASTRRGVTGGLAQIEPRGRSATDATPHQRWAPPAAGPDAGSPGHPTPEHEETRRHRVAPQAPGPRTTGA